MENHIARSTLGRLPIYLDYLKKCLADGMTRVSAPTIARDLGRGEVQVRKDLSSASDSGRPKLGYDTAALIKDIETVLGPAQTNTAVLVGAGRLGRALLDYEGFKIYNLKIEAAFDIAVTEETETDSGVKIYPLEKLESYCKQNNVRIGIITTPADDAQSVCDTLVYCGVKGIWNFAPAVLEVPRRVSLRQENLALSLAHLTIKINQEKSKK